MSSVPALRLELIWSVHKIEKTGHFAIDCEAADRLASRHFLRWVGRGVLQCATFGLSNGRTTVQTVRSCKVDQNLSKDDW